MNMKLKNTIVLVAAALLSLTSCLKDQTDVFDVPSSQRMQAFLEGVRTQLSDPSNKNGWVLSYYPGKDYATCYMGVVFTAHQVTAYSQDAPEEGVTSNYKLTEDVGPVLSFDTYNSVLHYYATSDASHYQARGGDFEFEIKSVEKDRIVLRGKRSGNYCYLDKASKEIPAFLKEINDAEVDFDIVAFSGEVTGGLVEGYLDGASHTLSIGRKGAESTELVTARYMIVPGGIHFNEPFNFQGVTFEDFVYVQDPENPAKGTLTGSGITFQKVVPAGYVPYNLYLGKWKLVCDEGDNSFVVELVEKEKGSSFTMKGFSSKFDVVLGYNAAMGRLSWVNQAVGSIGANTVVLAGWAAPAGTSLWPYLDEGVGMDGIVEDNSVEELVVNFEDNGIAMSLMNSVVHGWVLWLLDSNGNSAGVCDSWSMTGTDYRLPGDISLTKIVE